MIHLNVAFLVIRPTLNTIVKILIDASLSLLVNKYTSNRLFRACVATIWRVESMTWTRIIKHVHSINERLNEGIQS